MEYVKQCLSFLKNWVVVIVIFIMTSLILMSFFLSSLSKDLENSTKWVLNITPLILVIIGYLFKEEISNWHYKRRSEAASKIIGKFRTCSVSLVYYIDVRCLTPLKGEEAAEHKMHSSVNEYIKSCLEPSAEFPIYIRKALDKHFDEMKNLASRLAVAIIKDTDSHLVSTGASEQKESHELSLIKSTLENKQNFLDDLLGDYLQ